MPYITETNRLELDEMVRSADNAADLTVEKVGELNYLITTILINYVYSGQGLTYTKINNAVGVVECAKLELYRRLAAPYEDGKIHANGDMEGYAT